jgi:hypothetical protein
MRELLYMRNTLMVVLIILTSCTKSLRDLDKRPGTDLTQAAAARKPGGGGGGSTQTFRTYTIQQGSHSCDQSTFASVSGVTMSFIAKFDSSCIYTSIDPVNQWDINKLWGFNEGLFSTANSARVGWNWRDGALRLRPYTHVNGIASIDPPEVIVPIGAEIPCSITVQGSAYIFVINGTTITMPRGISSSKFSGYQLYPYFGGDEVAPHLITILIK